MSAASETAAQIEKLQHRLDALDRERAGVVAQLEHVKQLRPTDRDYAEPAKTGSPKAVAAVTMASGTAEKIALFRNLFRGREDVFPHRWQNTKTGRSGYSPVCNNEWARGL